MSNACLYVAHDFVKSHTWSRNCLTSGTPEFTTCFSGVCGARSLVFYVMICRSLFVLLAIVLSVLVRFMTSDYPFCNFSCKCIELKDLKMNVMTMIYAFAGAV